VANKIVLDTLHIESPVFCVPPAHGNLGPLARVGPPPAPEGDPQAILARQKLGARTHAVMGAALMRAFAYIRFDFPARKVRFSSSTAYRAPAPDAVLANLPLRDWRGRPAVQGTLDDRPITLVVDTAGDFDVAVPGPAEDAAGPLVLGSLQLDDVQVQTHAALGLPENFPARLGLGVLGRYIVTLDFKQQRVWIEGPPPAGPEKDTEATADESPAPVHYRGVKR
jgi:hypothetical protein